MQMLSRRVQYTAYIFFLIGTCLFCYSFFSNFWYKADFSETLKDSFVEDKYYTEGLLSVCWFGDCVSLGAVLPHKSLKTIFAARMLMIISFWILMICFCITIYKLHFTPDWWKCKALLGFLGLLEVFAGALMCISTFYYLYFHDLSRFVGGFQYGCYMAWLAGAMYIAYGLFAVVSVSSVVLPLHPSSKYSINVHHRNENTTSTTLKYTQEVISIPTSIPRLSKIFASL